MSRPQLPIVESAKEFSMYYDSVYRVKTEELALRRGPRSSRQVLKMLHCGDHVKCFGFFTKSEATTWLFVKDECGDAGYVSYNCIEKCKKSR